MTKNPDPNLDYNSRKKNVKQIGEEGCDIYDYFVVLSNKTSASMALIFSEGHNALKCTCIRYHENKVA